MRILIIEDSDTIRRMLEALLSARDDEVVAVGSAVEGLDNAYRFVPDVVVLDLNLPGAYDGFEVCARLRADLHSRLRLSFGSSAEPHFAPPIDPQARLETQRKPGQTLSQ